MYFGIVGEVCQPTITPSLCTVVGVSREVRGLEHAIDNRPQLYLSHKKDIDINIMRD